MVEIKVQEEDRKARTELWHTKDQRLVEIADHSIYPRLNARQVDVGDHLAFEE